MRAHNIHKLLHCLVFRQESIEIRFIMEIVLLTDVRQDPPKHEGVAVLHRLLPRVREAPLHQPVDELTTSENVLIDFQVVPEVEIEAVI